MEPEMNQRSSAITARRKTRLVVRRGRMGMGGSCGFVDGRVREKRRGGGAKRERVPVPVLWGLVSTGNNVLFGEGQSTCLADARQIRGCVGLGSSTDVPRERVLTGPMYQPQSLCSDYSKLKGSEVE